MKTKDEIDQQLILAISDLIDLLDEESQCLSVKDVGFMLESLCKFNIEAVSKYIKGQIEHGGSIFDKDLTKEIGHENIDQFWYNSAMAFKNKETKSE